MSTHQDVTGHLAFGAGLGELDQKSDSHDLLDALSRILADHRIRHRLSAIPGAEASGPLEQVALIVHPDDCGALPGVFQKMSEAGLPPVQRVGDRTDTYRIYFASANGPALKFLAADISYAFPDESSSPDVEGTFVRLFRTLAVICSDLTTAARDWMRPSGLQVVLLGPDGSGKTTMGAAVIQTLGPLFEGTRILQWRPQVIKPRLPQDPTVVEPPHSRPAYGAVRSLLQILAVVLDYWVGYLARIKPLLARRNLIVYDRDFNDVLVDPLRYRYGGPEWILRFLRKAIPEPETFFLVLDADTETILARKQEVPIEELRRQRIGYQQLAAQLPNSLLIRTDRNHETSSRKSCETIVAHLARRYSTRFGVRKGANSFSASDNHRGSLFTENTSSRQFGASARGAADRLVQMWPDWKSWLAKGTVAVLDQGLISGSNFVLSILLARWLGAREYGAYALAFAIFTLFSLLHQALILEPMSVFGPSTHRRSLNKYLSVLLWLQSAIGVTLFLVGAFYGAAARHWGLGPLQLALLGVTFASPCVLLFWFARRAFYLELLPSGALRGAVAYCVLLMAGVWLLARRGLLTPLTAFGVMGIAALLTSILLLIRLRVAPRTTVGVAALREVAQQHWHYGRWALAASFFFWVPWNIYYTFVAGFSGLAEAGTLRALMNFAAPIAQTFAAFSLLFLPYTSRVAQQQGWPGVKAQAVRVAGLFAAGAGVYWLLIALFSDRVIHFLYAGHYAAVVPLIPWVAMASILTGASLGPTIALRAMHQPASVCTVFFLSSLVAVAVGLPAVWLWGTRGAVLAIMLSSITAAISSFLMLRYQERRDTVRVASERPVCAEGESLSSF